MGFDFLVDPDLTAAEATVFWRPELDPATLELTTGDHPVEQVRVPPEPARWRGAVTIHSGHGGRFALYRSGPVRVRLWLSGRAPPGPATGVWLPLDRYFEERAATAVAFWKAAADPPVTGAKPRNPSPIPAQVALMRRRILRALDAKLAGATYRTIAIALVAFDEDASARGWKTLTNRAVIIRLVKAGLRLTKGDYRRLLLPPKRSPRRPQGGHG